MWGAVMLDDRRKNAYINPGEVLERADSVLNNRSFTDEKLLSEYARLKKDFESLLRSQNTPFFGPSTDAAENGAHKKMIKIRVSSGLYWVEIPDAGLRIQCGCPADSVKNLKKRGLILTREEEGVVYETGPNAILLSDVSIQNGSFANLAEFPVLQMLYRQGMMLPGHPNNKGVKPMLIGMEDIVLAQSKYIMRGNYGLISRDEIIATGIDKDEADKMMELKLRFAFGKIRDTGELLDLKIVDKDIIELRDDVYVHRVGLNVYEFLWNGESVTVDLNLPQGESYEPSYQLGIHEIRKEYFSIIHIGEGDGWDINRPCMSSIVLFQGKIYLIDAGPNILFSLNSLGIGINEIEGIFHTHAHDDHFAGLTSLIRSDHLIKYYATPLVRASVVKKLSALMSFEETRFSKYFEVHNLEFNTWNNVMGLQVKPVFSPHPIETSIMFFRTEWDDGYKTYAHLADTVSFDVLERLVKNGKISNMELPESLIDEVKEVYLTPVDLKKIDIGGGLIHGNALDFRNDESEKIILSHSEYELTDSQKEIGSNAAFGMQDVLINARQDYNMVAAHRFLSSYFPSVSDYELKLMLNHPVEVFNAGSILIRKGETNRRLFLIVSGVIEFIDPNSSVNYQLSAGSFVGEFSGLLNEPQIGTYRAASYVKALSIPCALYKLFVERNGIYDNVKRMNKYRQFLKNTWLFGEMVSYPIQNRIARVMESIAFKKGEVIKTGPAPGIYLLRQGDFRVFFDGKILEDMPSDGATPGFIGEDSVLLETASFLKASALTDSKAYFIPSEALSDIPIVQWKLLEAFNRRMKMFSAFFTFHWKDEYMVNIREFDEQHRTLFKMCNEIYISYKKGENLSKAADQLLNYMTFHFIREEALLTEHHYPDIEVLKDEHEAIINEIQAFRPRLKDSVSETDVAFLDVLKSWLVRHTLVTDRKYKTYMNERGVF